MYIADWNLSQPERIRHYAHPMFHQTPRHGPKPKREASATPASGDEDPSMMERETVFMFSGQGSQYYQMGRVLFDNNPIFRDWMLKLDAMVEKLTGNSIVRVLYSEERVKGGAFNRTMLTHPAIFMVEYSLAQSLIHAGVFPDITLGVSVGSFAAAAVAGFVEVRDAIAMVVGNACALEESCEPGGMVAVLDDPSLFSEAFLSERSELAAVNFSSHFVVSARMREMAVIEAELKSRHVTYQRLPVSFAFHSKWINGAKVPFETFLQSVEYKASSIPMMCCERVALLTYLPSEYFWNVVRRPMRFREATVALEQMGAHRYIDVGPASTLATFLKYVMPKTSNSTVHSILTPYGRELQNFVALTQMHD